MFYWGNISCFSIYFLNKPNFKLNALNKIEPIYTLEDLKSHIYKNKINKKLKQL